MTQFQSTIFIVRGKFASLEKTSNLQTQTVFMNWKILRSRAIVNHRWCRVRCDEVELPNGDIIDDFFVHIRPDIALVFPITPQQEVVFVRQYRHGVGKVLLELPAGGFDPKTEEAESAALRELTEETGYVAQKLTKLAELYDNPVKDTNTIHLFLAEGVEYCGKQQLDRTEEIEVVLIPIADLIPKITAGEICVSGSVTAIFMGLRSLQIT
jgi:ADP-ribose pyrophosphatase